MANFSYRAVDQEGKSVRGNIEASNLLELETRLAQIGLDLVTAVQKKETALQGGSKKVSKQELITFCFQMEQLAKAGVPLLDGLTDLRDSLPQSGLRRVVADLVRDIQGGKKFSESMAVHPKVFNEVTVSLVEAGESSGKLAEVFGKLTETLKWEDELAARTKKLIMYPAFAGTVVLGVALFLLVYLVPQLAGFIKNMSQGDLPWQTALMLNLSTFIRERWYVLLSTPPTLLFLLVMYARSGEKARYRLDGILLRLWAIGPILNKIIIARFSGFFAMMYAAGVTVLDGMEISERIVGNRVIAATIRRVREQIMEGKGITESFQMTGLFPPLVIRMLKIGETTGQLDVALKNVNYFYDREVKEAIEQLQAMIEPTMTVVLGLLLGSIMAAVLGPIYDVISKLKI
jgi:type IV pilus assembly protein PilC